MTVNQSSVCAVLTGEIKQIHDGCTQNVFTQGHNTHHHQAMVSILPQILALTPTGPVNPSEKSLCLLAK